MDALTKITEVAPDDPRLGPLIAAHLTFTHATSPACSVHSMGSDALQESGARLFAIFDSEDTALAMGALKRIDAGHVEVKSMHVAQSARGQGLAREMLDWLLAEAQVDGHRQVSLETGTQPDFAPARALYEAAGFQPCPPFADYVEDPHSAFYTRAV